MRVQGQIQVQVQPWYDFRQSPYTDYIHYCCSEVLKGIHEDHDEKTINEVLDFNASEHKGYFFIATMDAEPIGMASAYVTCNQWMTESVLDEHFLFVPKSTCPNVAAVVVKRLLNALEKFAYDEHLDVLCVSCSNKSSMDKYIKVLCKKGFNIETVSCTKRINHGQNTKEIN